MTLKFEGDIDEKEFSEQKRIFKSGSDVHGIYGFVRMLGRCAAFWE